ncbi:hypothetical protein [Herbaspirillum huttiense]|jgi:hypothetical protein|uniref:hypothetical protein n=1 Tax=Herbaspirillum huttiense TaxID=863372 RepID=UPI002176A085|nr:hypothetical protein [Herbaspirillum huttiense]UWE14286.1 hypothetical protein NY669_14260 [Herbaspirillum huttiense]
MNSLKRLWMFTLTLNRFFVMLLALVLLVGSVAGVLAWREALEQRSAVLREARFQFNLNTIKRQLESGLQVGLQLPEQTGMQHLIEQVRAYEVVIRSIDVFDAQGHIVFSTDGGGVGANIPVSWRQSCLSATAANWGAEDEEGRLLCGSVITGFDQVAGGVALRYGLADRSSLLNQVTRYWPMLLGLGATLLCGGGLLAWLLLRPLERDLQAQTAALAGDGTAHNDALCGPLADAIVQGHALQQALAQVDREADRLDNLEAS